MKKFMVLTVALLVLSAGSALAAITGSGHDFTTGTNSFTTEICAPCHTPHNATVGVGPLWAHSTSTATYTLYSSASLNATMVDPKTVAVSGITLACLSCHDGSVALDSFIGSSTSATTITGSALLGTALNNDHPVHFVYDAALVAADTATRGGTVGLQSPASASSVGTQALPLYATYVECSTCHDVHNTAGFTAGMLRATNAASALCLNCHIK